MKYYKKQLKRLELTRKLLKSQKSLLRELLLEGFTQVTFHTSTRAITLPFDADVTYEASSAYSQFLSKRIAGLKKEAEQMKEQWQRELEVSGVAAGDAEHGAAPGPNSIDN